MPKNVRNMKKAARTVRTGRTARPAKPPDDEMRAHYDFDYSKSRPNPFASQFAEGVVAVVLDPDVASVFRSSEDVNRFLRSAISAMPSESRKGKRAS
jgi:hypothetical protein